MTHKKLNESLVFLSGKRTPFGANGGSLREVHPTDLALNAAKSALAQAGISPKEIDHVILGNVLHATADSIYTARHVGLRAGVPQEIPALGINRLCGSGFQVIIEAFHQLLAGDTRIALVGGVESMSMAPFVLRKVRWGSKMGNIPLSDSLFESLTDTYIGLPMAITAENLAEKYQISREEADAFALRSQQKYQAALKEGSFKDEISPISIKDSRGNETIISADEHPKPDTQAETLAKLKAVFKKDGTVTAGNASGIVDGAAMMVVATQTEANKKGLKPLGRLISYGISGCDPAIMGIGPVSATHEALKRAKMTLDQMDVIEINEAFAPQVLAVAKELGLKTDSKLNVHGGAIALGHPLAASGTRIIQHILYTLKARNQRFGLGAACIGGGQGIAMIVESMHDH